MEQVWREIKNFTLLLWDLPLKRANESRPKKRQDNFQIEKKI